MPHLALLGDSIFDNVAYVGDGPDVITQVRSLLLDEWQASLSAIDGSMLSDVLDQLRGLSPSVTHVVISAGGNDALDQLPVLSEAVSSMTRALDRLAEMQQLFEQQYRKVLETALTLGRPTAVATIYYPRFPNPVFRRQAMTALAVYNDVIIRAASETGVPILDLRLVCDSPRDYANPIEPSSIGGAKIASAIVNLMRTHNFERREAAIYV